MGSGVQQRIQPRQTDNGSSLLELGVVRNGWDDDSEVLEVHGRREGVVGYSNELNQDRPTTGQVCLSWGSCGTVPQVKGVYE
jgi:hypothetical protein